MRRLNVQVKLQQVSLAVTLRVPLYKWNYSRSALIWLCIYHCTSEATVGQPCYDFVSTTLQVRLQQASLAMTLCLPLYKWSYSRSALLWLCVYHCTSEVRSALLWLCVYHCTSEVTGGRPCYDFVSTTVQVRLQQVRLAMTLCLPLYKWGCSRTALPWLCVYHCTSEAAAGQPCHDFVSTTVQVRLQQVKLATTLCLPLYKWGYSRSALPRLCVYHCTSEATAGQPCHDFVSTTVQVKLQQVSLAMTLGLPLHKWGYSRSALLWLCVYHCTSEATAGQPCYDFVSTTVEVKLQQVRLATTLCLPLYKWSYSSHKRSTFQYLCQVWVFTWVRPQSNQH